jgi:hypothetical protein
LNLVTIPKPQSETSSRDLALGGEAGLKRAARLGDIQRERMQLLAKRDEMLDKRMAVQLEVRQLFLEVEELSVRISQSEQGARYAATSFVEYCDGKFPQGRAYNSEDTLELKPASKVI